jgi:hypothetical protein
MAKAGTPGKLTPDRQAKILAAVQQVGITYKEAVHLAGISESAFYEWKRRSKDAAKLLPEDWASKTMKELMVWAAELDIPDVEMVGSGKGGRLLRVDVVEAVRERAGKYRDFFDALDLAELQGELQTIDEIRALGSGGRWVVGEDGVQVWQPIETVQTVYDVDGKVLKRIVTELRPDVKTLRFIAERRYKRWAPRKPIDPSASTADPHGMAVQMQKALVEIESSVPEESGP